MPRSNVWTHSAKPSDRRSRSLERALRDNGGDRLEELAAEIRRLEQEKAQRQQKADRHSTLLARIDETSPIDEADISRSATSHRFSRGRLA